MEVSTLLQNRKLRMVVPITQTAFIKAHLGHPQWDQCPGDPFSLEVTEITQSYFILSRFGVWTGQVGWERSSGGRDFRVNLPHLGFE